MILRFSAVTTALRICCGWKRNAHCDDSHGKRDGRCGVAADSRGRGAHTMGAQWATTGASYKVAVRSDLEEGVGLVSNGEF